MKIFYVFISFSISFYFLRILINKIRIKKQFDIYLYSLNKLKFLFDKSNDTKIILDKISINGIKLIMYCSVLLIPYLLCYFILIFLLDNYPLSIIISCLPYFSYFIVKNESI